MYASTEALLIRNGEFFAGPLIAYNSPLSISFVTVPRDIRRRARTSLMERNTSLASLGAYIDSTTLYNLGQGAYRITFVHVTATLYNRNVTERGPAAPWYDRVVAELARQGRTKTWLNRRSGVSRATIDNWEKQPKSPQAGTVTAVADVLGIPRDEAARLAGLPVEPLTARGVDPAELTNQEISAAIAAFAEELRRRADSQVAEPEDGEASSDHAD